MMSEEKKDSIDPSEDKQEKVQEDAPVKEEASVDAVPAAEKVSETDGAEQVKKDASEEVAKAKPENVPQKRGGQRNAPRRGMRDRKSNPETDGIERVVAINRVAKVVKGGKNFSFNALVVAGDGKGQAGIGFGKSNDVVGSITKGSQEAKKNFRKVQLKDDTIPHEIIGRFKASRIILKPASPGTGVIAGGAVRAVCDAVGIKNILTKSIGSRNSINVVKATMDGFLRLRLKRRG